MYVPKIVYPEITDKDIESFQRWIRRDAGFGPNGDCWVYRPPKSRKITEQYLRFYFPKAENRPIKYVQTHRLAYYILHDRQWTTLCVLHRCDFPPCCNPSHLFEGSTQDNNADMVAKNRHHKRDHPNFNPPRGIRQGGAKLDDDKVREARKLRAQGMKLQDIGDKWGVSRATINDIMRDKTWTHVQ